MSLPTLILIGWLGFVVVIYLIAFFDYIFYAHHWNKKLPILWNSLFDQ